MTLAKNRTKIFPGLSFINTIFFIFALIKSIGNDAATT
jgi:hypothetical protein